MPQWIAHYMLRLIVGGALVKELLDNLLALRLVSLLENFGCHSTVNMKRNNVGAYPIGFQ